MENNSILIVDDEKVNILALTRILRRDYVIYVATTGKDALELAKLHLPCIIILDILMPDMDGYEVITELKATAETKDIPVIFVTGLSNVGNEEKGLALGAADYIIKPFSDAIVRLRVQNQIKIVNLLNEKRAD